MNQFPKKQLSLINWLRCITVGVKLSIKRPQLDYFLLLSCYYIVAWVLVTLDQTFSIQPVRGQDKIKWKCLGAQEKTKTNLEYCNTSGRRWKTFHCCGGTFWSTWAEYERKKSSKHGLETSPLHWWPNDNALSCFAWCNNIAASPATKKKAREKNLVDRANDVKGKPLLAGSSGPWA